MSWYIVCVLCLFSAYNSTNGVYTALSDRIGKLDNLQVDIIGKIITGYNALSDRIGKLDRLQNITDGIVTALMSGVKLHSYERAVGELTLPPVNYGRPLSFQCRNADSCSIERSGFGYNVSVPLAVYLIGWHLECYFTPGSLDGKILVTVVGAHVHTTGIDARLSHNNEYVYSGSATFIEETDSVDYSWLILRPEQFTRCISSKWVIRV